ncbi:serine hydrolase [Sinorhizobium medicae]|nr:serine hydrolase [Sinorhizobium medicae]
MQAICRFSVATGLIAAVVLSLCQTASAKNQPIEPPAKAEPIKDGSLLGDIPYRCDERPEKRCSVTEFMRRARVCALILVKSGKLRFRRFNTSNEFCRDDAGPNGWAKRYGVASVAKSVTSTLLGHAIATRYRAKTRAQFVAVLRQPTGRFIEEYAGAGVTARSPYAGVSLDQVLRMRSGVRWTEYSWRSWFSDNERFRRRVREGRETVVEFASRYRSVERKGGAARFNYSALDAAMVAVSAEIMLKGERLTKFLERELWDAIGAEASASWGVDVSQTAIGSCCFRATVRDLARFGMLVLAKGRDADGRQVIPGAWFDIATKRDPSGADKIPLDSPSFNPGCPLDYRYFWWLFPNRTDFTAIGRSGQFVHVYPDYDTVIVQISDWGAWENGNDLECKTFKAHDALVKAMQ